MIKVARTPLERLDSQSKPNVIAAEPPGAAAAAHPVATGTAVAAPRATAPLNLNAFRRDMCIGVACLLVQ
ncbi:hypothetical protein KZO37_21585 [Rhodococcus fascians]|uniref:hypothetical protein n=1 Tax=Rhodococcoides fascians TaxID=1828 RepID=UPI001C5CDB8E|nr:hypothetical protein [Rhodococcus fascians]MBW4781958.1 hypothetical protein [Rhodococcus fascians]